MDVDLPSVLQRRKSSIHDSDQLDNVMPAFMYFFHALAKKCCDDEPDALKAKVMEQWKKQRMIMYRRGGACRKGRIEYIILSKRLFRSQMNRQNQLVVLLLC